MFTDSFTLASFADKNAGTAKSISVTGISISGADAGNYTFNTTATATADITPRPLTIAATGVNRVYNGTTEVLVGGVQRLQIWCYNAAGTLDSNLDNIREVLIQIKTQTERTAQAGSPGDQHAVVEGRVRFRNI